jgi:hypothetical protein
MKISPESLSMNNYGEVIIGDNRITEMIANMSDAIMPYAVSRVVNSGCTNDTDCTNTNNVGCTNSGTC